jgi:hypothetical protein
MKSVYNVGGWDRAARIILGVVMLFLGVSGLLGKYSGLGLYGLIPLATGLMRFCPFYPLFGISTCKPKQKD